MKPEPCSCCLSEESRICWNDDFTQWEVQCLICRRSTKTCSTLSEAQSEWNQGRCSPRGALYIRQEGNSIDSYTSDELRAELDDLIAGHQMEILAAVLAEREACATACRDRKIADDQVEGDWDRGYNAAIYDCAWAIRKRVDE